MVSEVEPLLKTSSLLKIIAFMACTEKNNRIVSLRLGNGCLHPSGSRRHGWSGRALISDLSDEAYRAKADSSGKSFSKDDWLKCLSQPHLLFENVSETLKIEGRNCVAVKTLTIADTKLKVVIKRHWPENGLRQFFRSLRPGKALRNFKTALQLQRLGIPAAAPLAALQEKKGLFTRQSIYITSYLEGSCDLHTFCQQQLSSQLSLRKHLSNQLAAILATLHKNGLWHRDPKASNFLVTPDDKKLLLIDVDGIKPYRLRRKSRQLRSLWQLGASLMSVSAVNRTDYLRTFTTYCNLVGLEHSQRRRVFRQFADRAEAKHLRSTIENILIIKPSSLGDIVLTLPALSALRRSFPAAKISWLIRPEFAPLLNNHPHLDNIIQFDRKFLGKAWYNPFAFAALLSLIHRLRRGKFDVVIDLQGLFRTASLAWLSGCKKRLGMATAREFAHIFYTHKVAQDRSCIHLVDYYLRVAQAAGAADISVEFILNTDRIAADSVRHLLASQKINPDNYAVIVPGAARSGKCWPIERFAALAEKISSQFGFSIVATGTQAEKSVVENLRRKTGVTVANLAGLTNLRELAALMKSARLVVSNDTGPGHIAAALNTPVVMIFGYSNPARVAPYGRSHCVAAVEPGGRGFNDDSKDPKHDIKAVTVDEVYQKVCEQMGHKPTQTDDI
jgi:lipopolysaccharide heptosyltransferase I